MNNIARTITLPDGRALGFAQYGDPKGKPIFLFHGWPSSRLSGSKYNVIATQLHIRIITSDRPGYGLSDFQPTRTLLDWPDDVTAIADYLRIGRFAVMGVSGGGPYAAVCAYKIPNRITKVGIVVGLSPVYSRDAFDGVTWTGKIAWLLFAKHPLIRWCAVFNQYLYSRLGGLSWINRLQWGSMVDQKLYRDPALSRWGLETTREAFRSGLKGSELDLKLYTTDWGFDVSKIKTKTYLWYGGDDRNLSLNMGKYYASKIHGSKLVVIPGEGHLISITHAEEIFKTLTTSL